MADKDSIKQYVRSQNFLEGIPHMAALGVELVDFGPGNVTVRLPYAEKLVGNPDTGILAGGAISALLDNCCGSAVVAKTMKFASFATLDLRIDYMKPAQPGEDVLAFAECYKLTRRIAFVRGVAYHDRRDNPVAHAAATFMFTGRGTISNLDDEIKEIEKKTSGGAAE